MSEFDKNEYLCGQDCNNSLTDCGMSGVFWVLLIVVFFAALCN